MLSTHTPPRVEARALADQIRRLLRVDPEEADTKIARLEALAVDGDPEIRRTAAFARAYASYSRGAYPDALADCELVLDVPGDPLLGADAANLAGTVAFEQADYPTATARFLEAQRAYEAISARGPYANTLNNLALVHWRLGDDEGAAGLFRRALTIYEELGDARAIGTALYNLGLVVAPGDPRTGLEYHRRAVPWLERASDVQGLGNAFANAADCLESLGELDEAEKCAEKALACRLRVRHRRGQAGSHLALARLAMARGDVHRAETELEKALPLVREMNLGKQEVDALRLAAQVYAAEGRYRQAWEFEAMATERREALLGEDAARRTAEVEARFELQHARREAERRALEAEELRVARESALAASRAKSEFLAVMSHEIRTPLTVLIGNAELLGHTDLSPRQMRLQRKLDESARSLLALVSDILDFSRIEAGHVTCSEVAYSPADVLRRAEEAATSRFPNPGVLVRTRVSGAIPQRVRGDRDHLLQILTNLMGNALKFTPSGEVETTASFPDDHTLQIAVRDTGIGIAPEELDRLFEPFTQVDGSNRREYGGAGLGLAIAQSLAVAMGGSLTAKSNPGVGSVFTVRVPVRPETVVPLTEVTTVPPSDDGGDVVLVVDDNPDVRHTVVLLLEAIGATAIEAPSGSVALDVLRQFHPDLVLLDVQMPGMDGYTVARELRAVSSAPLYVVGLTGSATEEARLQGLQAGMDDYVAKPIDLLGLRRILSQARRFRRVQARSAG